MKMKPPDSIKEFRTYLGLVNYFRPFVPQLVWVCRPLFHGLKGTSVSWSSEMETAFYQIRGGSEESSQVVFLGV